MRIGFTGSRDGMTQQQKQTLIKVLQEYWPVEFHHGDGMGYREELVAAARGVRRPKFYRADSDTMQLRWSLDRGQVLGISRHFPREPIQEGVNQQVKPVFDIKLAANRAEMLAHRNCRDGQALSYLLIS